MRNDARPVGVDSPASPLGGDTISRDGEPDTTNRGTEEEPKREEPPKKQPEVKEPPDPTMPSDDPTIRTEI